MPTGNPARNPSDLLNDSRSRVVGSRAILSLAAYNLEGEEHTSTCEVLYAVADLLGDAVVLLDAARDALRLGDHVE